MFAYDKKHDTWHKVKDFEVELYEKHSELAVRFCVTTVCDNFVYTAEQRSTPPYHADRRCSMCIAEEE